MNLFCACTNSVLFSLSFLNLICAMMLNCTVSNSNHKGTVKWAATAYNQCPSWIALMRQAVPICTIAVPVSEGASTYNWQCSLRWKDHLCILSNWCNQQNVFSHWFSLLPLHNPIPPHMTHSLASHHFFFTFYLFLFVIYWFYIIYVLFPHLLCKSIISLH